jgi:CHASE2 domain-containing sensor protein
MTSHDRTLFVRSAAIGVFVTLLVLIADELGRLDSLEDWLYDHRAAICQFTTPQPTDKLVHLDIDDAALDAIGRWPWHRATLARILDEVQAAHPGALGLDILFSEPEEPRLTQDADGTIHKINDDAALATVLAKSGVAVLATEFYIEAGNIQSPASARITKAFADDLEQSPEAFAKNIASAGETQLEETSLNELFLSSRRAAMKSRVEHEMDQGPVPLDKLTARLLPHTDPNIGSPLIRLLQSDYGFALAEQSIQRFGAVAPPLSPPPVYGTLTEVPAPIFSAGAASCAVVDYNIFGKSKIRDVPLFVQYKNRLYPQFGMATACVMLGADPTKVRFTGSTAIIPTRNSGEISIPTYVYHSKTQGLDVSLITAIPWFGTQDWQTMYDWPAHRNHTAQHVSLANVWAICEAIDRIAQNSKNIDNAISQVLNAADEDNPSRLGLDPDLYKKYAALRLNPQEITTREKWAADALKQLDESGWLHQYDITPENIRTDIDHLQHAKLLDAVDALHNAVHQNHELHNQIQDQRKILATQVGGKGVLVGFIANGLEDRVTTSLHIQCPGVVVHGVIANAVLTNRWWRVAPPGVTILLTLFFGLATTAAQGRYSAERANFLSFLLLFCYWVLNGLVLFGIWGWVVGLAGPTLVVVAVAVICTLVRVITEAIERIRVSAENSFFQKEMSLARKVQFALIPNQPPEMDGHNADGWTLPADMTGGDLFDLWMLPDGRMGLLVADASGHGLAPAMIVSQVRTLVHMLSEYEEHPHALLQRVNARLALDLEAGRFVTAFLAFISSDGKVDWASAGHGPMFWAPTGDGEMQELSSSGLPLGVQEDWFADEPSPPLQLETNGRLIVVSDGIFEAHSPTRKLWGTDPIKDILHKSPLATSREIIDAIRKAVVAWQEKIEPVDDQTIVVVRRISSMAPPTITVSPDPSQETK